MIRLANGERERLPNNRVQLMNAKESDGGCVFPETESVFPAVSCVCARLEGAKRRRAREYWPITNGDISQFDSRMRERERKRFLLVILTIGRLVTRTTIRAGKRGVENIGGMGGVCSQRKTEVRSVLGGFLGKN